jgi:hypothetical protein
VAVSLSFPLFLRVSAFQQLRQFQPFQPFQPIQ